MGVIINKPLADIELVELLEQLQIEPQEKARETPVFFGGPVQTERGVVLHTLDYRLDGTVVFGRNIGLTASKDVLMDIGGKEPGRAPPRRFILVIGHAGWGAGQLEQEITMNAWAHCEPDEAIVFDGAHAPIWQRALSKLGVKASMFSAEWSAVRDEDQPLN